MWLDLDRRLHMRKLLLKMSMALDGFVAGPNGEQDWFFRTRDEVAAAWTVAAIASAGIHAVGRTSWEGWKTVYPAAAPPFARAMNTIPKVVFTRTGVQLPAPSAVDSEIVRSW